MFDYDPDAQRFRDYAEGHTNDSPVDLSGREGAPRCSSCHAAIDEDKGCLDCDEGDEKMAGKYIVYTDGGYEQSFATEAEAVADVSRLASLGINATRFKIQ